jgi:hypothetical protein
VAARNVCIVRRLRTSVAVRRIPTYMPAGKDT